MNLELSGIVMKKLGKLSNRLIVLIIVVNVTMIFNGCAVEKLDTSKQRDLDYTIVRDAELPEELAAKIEETQDVGFKLTYEDGEYLYIAKGYGMQKTGGYSVFVTNLYASNNTLYFETDLTGPMKGENVNSEASYPYIVVKTEVTEQPVVFK